jgi:aerobic carbon-monoxide dehydrogenase large subunit
MVHIGARVPRREDARLLTGRGRFVDDEARPGQLWMRVVRSTIAHGLLLSVDKARAIALPGVRCVLTGADIELPLIPVRVSPRAGDLQPYLQPVLASNRVRYVGEPVAVVLAEDPYLAEDGAELVDVDYRELAPLLDAVNAFASTQSGPPRSSGEPELFPGHPNEVAAVTAEFGDPSAEFRRAAHVVELELTIGRQTAVPIEPRGLLAEWDEASQSLAIWGATKVPHFNRRAIATALGLAPEQIRMHASDAGGGFGVRGELYPEDFLVSYLARLVARPIKWTEDRAEHLVAVNHSRDQRHRIAGAFDPDGRLLAIRDEIWHDNGAYVRTHGVTVPELTVSMLPGPYRMDGFAATAHVFVTNKTPCGTYRAPGRYEGTFARERMLDAAADALGIDRVELRRRNLLGPDELPCDRSIRALGTDVVLDEGDYPALLERAVRESGYASWAEDSRQRRAAGHLVGTGIAVFLEKSGLGPYEVAEVQVDTSGKVHLASGGTSLGQGLETVLAQIAADALGVNPSDVIVSAGDTGTLNDGVGSWASRSTVVGGSAAWLAAQDTAQIARAAAAVMLGVQPEDLCLGDGRIAVRKNGSSIQGHDRPCPFVTLGEVASALADPSRGLSLPVGPLCARRDFAVTHMTYPYGVHLAHVEIDSDTGAVKVLDYFVVYEVGRAINPANVEDQIIGGAIQGIGGALLERLEFGPDGQPLTANLIDYLLPFASEATEIGTLVSEDHPAPTNPLGVRGAGEGGIAAAGAAIASAVGDALGLVGAPASLPITEANVVEFLEARKNRLRR